MFNVFSRVWRINYRNVRRRLNTFTPANSNHSRLVLIAHRMRHSLFTANRPKMKSPNSSVRRANKPLMERKRRARINDYLGQLKEMVLVAMKKENMNSSKFEKADILEMTVDYMKSLHRSQQTKLPDLKYPCKNTSDHTVHEHHFSEDIKVSLSPDNTVNTKLELESPSYNSKQNVNQQSISDDVNNSNMSTSEMLRQRVESNSDVNNLHTPLSITTTTNSTMDGISYEQLSRRTAVQHAKVPATNQSATQSYRLVPRTSPSGQVQLTAVLVSTPVASDTIRAQSVSPNSCQGQHHLQNVSPSYMQVGTPIYIGQQQPSNYVVTLQLVNKNSPIKSHPAAVSLWRPW